MYYCSLDIRGERSHGFCLLCNHHAGSREPHDIYSESQRPGTCQKRRLFYCNLHVDYLHHLRLLTLLIRRNNSVNCWRHIRNHVRFHDDRFLSDKQRRGLATCHSILAFPNSMDGRNGYHRVTFSYHSRLGNRGAWSFRGRSTRSDTWQVHGNLQINSPTYVVSLYFTNCRPSYFTVTRRYGSLWCHLSLIHDDGYRRIFDQTSQPCLLGFRIHPIRGYHIHVHCRNEFRFTLRHVARQIPQIISWWRV